MASGEAPVEGRGPGIGGGPIADDAAAAAAAAGVTAWREDGAVAPRCPICSGAVHWRTGVRCLICDTPHHADCLEWNGRCAIFGCTSQDYVPAWELHQGASAQGRAAMGGLFASSSRRRARRILGDRAIRIEGRTFGRAMAALLVSLSQPQQAPAGYRYRWLKGIHGPSGRAVALTGVEMLCFLGLFSMMGVLSLPLLIGSAAIGFFLFIVGNLASDVLVLLMNLAGRLLYRLDRGTFELDTVSGQLVQRRSFVGLPLGRTTWPAKGIERVVLGHVQGLAADVLTFRFQEGEELVVSDDQSAIGIGYDRNDLSRLGRRAALALGVPFQDGNYTSGSADDAS